MKKAIFTLDIVGDPMDLLLQGSKSCPYEADCFYVTKSHWDFPRDLDLNNLPDDFNPLNAEPVKEDIKALTGITMRMRFASKNSLGPFLLCLPEGKDNFEREDVDRILQGWWSDGIIKEKLEEAKIKI